MSVLCSLRLLYAAAFSLVFNTLFIMEFMMPQVMVKDVTMAFTQCMTTPSDFGGYNYSFIIDSARWCEVVRDAIKGQKKRLWGDEKNTDEFIISKTAKKRDEVKYDTVRDMMQASDVLVQVKSNTAIENTKDVSLSRGSTANVLVDIFEFEYAKKQFICVKSHSDRGCTVQPINVVEYADSTFFAKESDSKPAVNMEAVALATGAVANNATECESFATDDEPVDMPF